MGTTTYYSNRPAAAGPSLDPLVLAHQRRVEQAGGQHLDVPFLSELVALLRQWNLTDKIMHLSDVRLGCLVDEVGQVSRLFCLGGHDALAAGATSLPQWVPEGLNGKPCIQFAQTGFVVDDFDFSQSDSYTLVTLLRQLGADGTGAMMVCQPTNTDIFLIMPNYGYMRCRHIVYYTGQDLVVNEGTNYDGGWLTMAARYNLARLEGQFVGNFYGFRFQETRQMGYAFNNARGSRLGPAPLYIGSTDDGGFVGGYLLRDFDDEVGMNRLRDFIQADYLG
jgi:hypothetical protein